ncbi:MAG TPA: 16S rRNA (cytidine(1402)-2'-O)-methyltransferase [Firmicutes bacterium]|nr:16S rRNA (cytidine(1402)-2'-O)-methyltransferase [Bacillota bacterium]
MESEAGTLFVCATPIGNLDDVSQRLLQTLAQCDIVAAEDTRRTIKLLNHFGIKKPLVSCWQHREREASQKLLESLQQGSSVALVSDAGTPVISDPGQKLIALALANGIRVVHIPGPSAVIAALVLSGFPADKFVFEGFLPRKRADRRKALRALAEERRTIVLFEAPHRLHDALRDIAAEMGDPQVAVARELTKVHEEVLRGKASEVLTSISGKAVKGEITIVISPMSA